MSFKLLHENDLRATDHVKINPDANTADLVHASKLNLSLLPDGMLVLFKQREEFATTTVVENIVVNGINVVNEKVSGYHSIGANGTFHNWLPDPADFILTFYLYVSAKYREGTAMEGLGMDEYIKYDASELEGKKIVDAFITERTKPDAIVELSISDGDVIAGTEQKIEFQTKII